MRRINILVSCAIVVLYSALLFSKRSEYVWYIVFLLVFICVLMFLLAGAGGATGWLFRRRWPRAGGIGFFVVLLMTTCWFVPAIVQISPIPDRVQWDAEQEARSDKALDAFGRRFKQQRSTWDAAFEAVIERQPAALVHAESVDELEAGLQLIKTYEAETRHFVEIYAAARELFEQELMLQGVESTRYEAEMSAFDKGMDPKIIEYYRAHIDYAVDLRSYVEFSIDEWGNWSINPENGKIDVADPETLAVFITLKTKASETFKLLQAKRAELREPSADSAQ